ncbi:hypothetical protein [Alteromonas sp. 14N.309.X.WAT.G.H12]|uniref:hypothetical protein n=1 Tax=Alteromonas sp. 14N.309.X.WAT.G.H12 TaxID=3120824 RepID=UPI002FD04441
MKIEILSPFFKCQEEQTVFLSHFYSLPDYKSLVTTEARFQLRLKSTADPAVFQQVKDICDNWNTSCKVVD